MSQTTLGERDELWAAARSDPEDTSLWPRLLAAHARLGRIEEGARRLRDLLLASPRSEERNEIYLETLWRGGFGVGDPGLQAPRPHQTVESPDRRHLAVASARLGLEVHETATGAVVLDPVELGPAFILRWLDDARLVVVKRPEASEKTSITIATCSIVERSVTVVKIDLGLEWDLEQLRLDPRGHWLVLLRKSEVVVVEPSTKRVIGVGVPFTERTDVVRFSPASDLLYLGRFIDRMRGHILVDLRAATATQLTLAIEERWTAEWSDDGRWLAIHGSHLLVPPVSRNPWDDDDTGSPGVYRMLATVIDTKDGTRHALEGLKDGEEPFASFAWKDGVLHVADVQWTPPSGPARRTGPAPAEPTKKASALCHELDLSFTWTSDAPLGLVSERKENPARRPLGHEHGLSALWVSGDGRRLLTSESGRRGWVWDLESGRRLARAKGERSLLGLTRDGKSWFTVDDGYSLHPVAGGAPVEVAIQPMEPPHRAYFDLMDVSPDGQRVVVKGWPRCIELFETGSTKPLAKNEQIPSAVSALRFTQDGERVMLVFTTSVYQPSDAVLLDARTLGVVASWKVKGVPYSMPEPTLVELPGRDGLAVVGDGTAFACRRHAEAEPLVPRTKKAKATGALAFSPDGQELALATDRGIELWDFSKKKPALRGTIDAPFLPVRALVYLPDGSLLYTQAAHVRRARD